MRSLRLAVALTALCACSSDSGADGPARRGASDGGRTPSATDTGGGRGEDTASEPDTGSPSTLDVSAPDASAPDVRRTDTGDRVEDGCIEMSAVGDPIYAPVDIIWVIDTSGSMNEERELVEAELNDFVRFFEESGLDVRVVMIGDDTVCVPAPLSGGGCPDTDSTRYRHVRRTIGSHDAFEHVVEAYPEYADFLRPEAIHHFVVVSDDESDTRAIDFRDDIAALRIGRWTFHAIVSLIETNCVLFICEGCSGEYGDAEAKGDQYMLASELTDGTANSICESDWTPTFEAITENVVSGATLPCQYAIPDLGDGLDIVYDRVDVTINGVALTRHDAPEGCLEAPGWYYDDPDAPAQVILCPAFCGAGFEGDEVAIEFGCVKA